MAMCWWRTWLISLTYNPLYFLQLFFNLILCRGVYLIIHLQFGTFLFFILILFVFFIIQSFVLNFSVKLIPFLEVFFLKMKKIQNWNYKCYQTRYYTCESQYLLSTLTYKNKLRIVDLRQIH